MRNILLLSGLILILHACQKDDEMPITGGQDCMGEYLMTSYVRKVEGATDSMVFQLFYDTANRVSRRVIYSPEDSSSFDYDYWEYDAEGNCTKHGYFPLTGAPDIYYEYDNLQGRRSETRYFSSISPGAPIELRQTTVFNYTGDQLSLIENYQNGVVGSEASFTYTQNGQRVNMDYYSTDDSSTIQNLTWQFLDQPNPLWPLELRFGYPIRRMAIDTFWDNFDNSYVAYEYTSDTEGRIIKVKQKYSEPNSSANCYQLFYTCQ